MHVSGSRVRVFMNRTWPLATNEMMACVPALFIVNMCGRTGLAPVCAMHSAAAAPPRSTFSATACLFTCTRSFASQM
jgi:hypothetical protein